MGRKAEPSQGTCDRALQHWLSIPTRNKAWCSVENGHVYAGSASQHLSKSGCGYRALIRMRVRLGLLVYKE